MNPPVILRRIAQAEFDDAADWYEGQRVGAAVRKVLTNIAARPEAHPEVYDDVREALVSRYPYAIYYRLGPSLITVLAVFHTGRNPTDWESRV